jgi:hypothetical protein
MKWVHPGLFFRLVHVECLRQWFYVGAYLHARREPPGASTSHRNGPRCCPLFTLFRVSRDYPLVPTDIVSVHFKSTAPSSTPFLLTDQVDGHEDPRVTILKVMEAVVALMFEVVSRLNGFEIE